MYVCTYIYICIISCYALLSRGAARAGSPLPPLLSDMNTTTTTTNNKNNSTINTTTTTITTTTTTTTLK